MLVGDGSGTGRSLSSKGDVTAEILTARAALGRATWVTAGFWSPSAPGRAVFPLQDSLMREKVRAQLWAGLGRLLRRLGLAGVGAGGDS